MSDEKLEIRTALLIDKPTDEVFDAIVDPSKMINYFISKSTGRLEEGKTVIWQFPEIDLEFPVHVKQIDPATASGDRYISFTWNDLESVETLVEISLEPKEHATLVIVKEKSRDNNEAGIKWLKENTEGWANFLACLKAYLEYGINLRYGAFDTKKE